MVIGSWSCTLLLLAAACTMAATLGSPSGPRAGSRPFRPHPSMLRTPLQVVGSSRRFWAREVPGDGSCLFHTLAAAIKHQETGKHLEFGKPLYDLSSRLRQLAVDALECKDAPLYLGDGEASSTTEMLSMVAAQYNTTAAGYCEMMRRPREWGGGPEIVALSNLLRLPIHVYELHTRRLLPRRFQLRESARFGSPRFDAEGARPLCILCADGRFPDIAPGAQKEVGDHFMPLFDVLSSDAIEKRGPFPLYRSVIRNIKFMLRGLFKRTGTLVRLGLGDDGADAWARREVTLPASDSGGVRGQSRTRGATADERCCGEPMGSMGSCSARRLAVLLRNNQNTTTSSASPTTGNEEVVAKFLFGDDSSSSSSSDSSTTS